MSLQVKDKVLIIGGTGEVIAMGRIVNINDFREPSQKYAVDVDGYTKDVIFIGESQLIKNKKADDATIEEYLRFFKEQNTPIQITLDIGKQPTVHALFNKEVGEKSYIQMTEEDTLLQALESMKEKLFG